MKLVSDPEILNAFGGHTSGPVTDPAVLDVFKNDPTTKPVMFGEAKKEKGGFFKSLSEIDPGVGEEALYGQPDRILGNVFSAAKRIPGDVLRGMSAEMKAEALSIRPEAGNEDAWYSHQLSIMSSIDKARTLSLAGKISDAGMGIDTKTATHNAIDKILDEKKKHAVGYADAMEKAANAKAFQPLKGYEEPQDGFEAVLQGIGQQIPRMPLMMAAPWAAVPEMYLEITGATYKYLTDHGVDPDRARTASRLDAVAQTPLEFLGDLVTIRSILGATGWKSVISGIARSTGTEGLEEFAQQYPDEAATYWAMNPNATTKDVMDHVLSPETLKEAIYAAAVGGATGGILAGAGGGLKLAVTKRQQEINDQNQQNLLSAISKARVGEKLNESEQAMLDKVTDSVPEEVFKRYSFQSPIITDARESIYEGIKTTFKGDEEKAGAIMTVLDSIAHSYGDILGVEPEVFYEKELSGYENMTYEEFSQQNDLKRAAQYQASQNQTPLGATVWTTQGEAIIYAFERANASTPIHETGHVLLGLIQKYDPISYDAVSKWTGIDSERSMRGLDAWTTQEHEKFAKGFEAYMMEGRAPSFRLVPVFRKLKTWLLEIYRRIRNLNVKLDDNVRAVFDKWLTNEDERSGDMIRDMSEWFDVDEATHPIGDIRPEDIQTYEDLAAKAQGFVASKMDEKRRKQMAQVRRDLHAQAEAIVNDMEIYIDLDELASIGKFSEDVITKSRNWSGDELQIFREKGVMSKKGKINPDQFVSARVYSYGRRYETANEFLDMVLAMPTKKDMIEQTFSRLMSEFEQGLGNEGAIIEDMGDIINAELKILSALMGKRPESSKAKALEVEAIESLTKEQIDDLRREYRELDKVAMEAFNAGTKEARDTERAHADEVLKAEKEKGKHNLASIREKYDEQIKTLREKGAQKVSEARARGLEKVAAAKARQKEIIQALRERNKIAKEKAKIVKRMKKYMKNKDMRYEARYQLLNLLTRYFKTRGFTVDTKHPSLEKYLRDTIPIDMGTSDWVGEMIDALPDPWRDSENKVTIPGRRSLADLRAVAEVADLIFGLDKMLRAEDRQEKKAERLELSQAILKANDKEIVPQVGPRFSNRETMPEQLRNLKDMGSASLMKMEFLCRWLDGQKDIGSAFYKIFKPMADAEDRELEMLKFYAKQLHKIMDPIAKDLSWTKKKIDIGNGIKLTKEQMFMIALNSGNEGNRKDLISPDGNNIPDNVIGEIINTHLSKEEYGAVEKIWEILDSLYPLLNEVHQGITGTNLKKVEGHYFPIVHDRKLSWWVAKTMDQNNTKGMAGAPYYMSNPKAGHREERTGKIAPIKLDDVGIVQQHIMQAIHDVTHTLPIKEVYKTISDENVRRAIVEIAGQEMYDIMTPWLRDIARPRTPADKMDVIAKHLRNSATVVSLGFKATVSALQLTSITQTMEKLGYKDTMAAVADFCFDMPGTIEMVNGKSIMMRFRGKQYDREQRDVLQRVSMTRIGRSVESAKELAFTPIIALDLAVAYPTWLGAYNKGLKEYRTEDGMPDENKAITYADSVVRSTQGAAGSKDLAAVQRGGELGKLVTMFYSFFSVYHNRVNETARERGISGYDNPATYLKWLNSFFLLTFAPVAMSFLLFHGRPPKDDEWIKEMVSYRLGGLPVIRDIVDTWTSGFDYEVTPAASGPKQMGKLIKDTYKAIDDIWNDEDVAWGRIGKDAAMATGYTFGIPMVQPLITMAGIIDLWEGETTNPMRLLFKPPRDEED